jgi:hypothetical protein
LRAFFNKDDEEYRCKIGSAPRSSWMLFFDGGVKVRRAMFGSLAD